MLESVKNNYTNEEVMNAFILGFQEPVEAGQNAECGTQTFTKTNGEQTDSDVSKRAGRAIPSGENSEIPDVIEMATKTKTAVNAESADADPQKSTLRAIPPCC